MGTLRFQSVCTRSRTSTVTMASSQNPSRSAAPLAHPPPIEQIPQCLYTAAVPAVDLIEAAPNAGSPKHPRAWTAHPTAAATAAAVVAAAAVAAINAEER